MSAKQQIDKVSHQSTCAYCGVGCGIELTQTGGEITSFSGMKEHPANFGKLCIKGTHLPETLRKGQRLNTPMIHGKTASWDDAIEHVSTRLNDIIREYGPDAVAFYASGQLLTEDYYVANKLMKGYIGSANIDTNSRLCMSSAVAAYVRAFGEDVVPCDYDDLDESELIILVGSNAAWTHPILFQRMLAARSQSTTKKIIVIDPRRSDSAEQADMHLPIKPGTDAALYNGLLLYLYETDACDDAYINTHTDGFTETLALCRQWTVQKVAEFCALSIHQVLDFYNCFASSDSVISFYSMGINQSSSGVDKCNAIINAHLASGQLLKPGAGPFSITGQPNAMGGREVGGLANQLAAHLSLENKDHREAIQAFWQSPTIATKPGAKAVEMFEKLANGSIKAVWIMATNPLVSLPNRREVEAALARCDLVIVSDCVSRNDTLDYANVQFPVTGWGEKNGTVTNSERRISRQRGFATAPGQAKHDWQVLADVGSAMGFDGFDFPTASSVFAEWAACTEVAARFGRQLNLSQLKDVTEYDYNALVPTQWPIPDKVGEKSEVFKGNQFSTDNGRAKFIPITPRLPKFTANDTFPLILNSGRIRDQWHTMTRTGVVEKLGAHISRPFVDVNKADAQAVGLSDGQLVKVVSATGSYTAHAKVGNKVTKGTCFAPIHWSLQNTNGAAVNALFERVVDPISGQPESKQTPIYLKPIISKQFIEIFCPQNLSLSTTYWNKRQFDLFNHYSCEHEEEIAEQIHWLQQLIQIEGEWIACQWGEEITAGTNLICLKDDKLVAAAFFDIVPIQVQSNWLSHLFSKNAMNATTIGALMRLMPDEEFLQGEQICACHNVREVPIITAISAGTNTVEALGEKLRCGTNCGSCKSQLATLIKKHATSNKSNTKGEVIHVSSL